MESVTEIINTSSRKTNAMHLINIIKESVTIFHHENGQDKMNNIIFTWNITFPYLLLKM